MVSYTGNILGIQNQIIPFGALSIRWNKLQSLLVTTVMNDSFQFTILSLNYIKDKGFVRYFSFLSVSIILNLSVALILALLSITHVDHNEGHRHRNS